MSIKTLLVSAASALTLLTATPTTVLADVEYIYDSAGRLIQVIYPNGLSLQYRYDSAGNRREIISGPTPNRPPSAVNDTATVETSAFVDILVRANDTDPDGDALSVTAVSSVSGGGTATIRNSGAHVRYTAPTTTGTKSFTYTVEDADGASDTATVTVTVTQGNRAPNAVNDSAWVLTGGSVAIMVRANDSDLDGNPLTITSVTQPGSGNGSVSIASGGTHVVYSAPSTPGDRTFTYTISDGDGGVDTATVTVAVAQANRAPNAVNDTATVFPLAHVDILVRSNDTDADGHTLTVTSVGTPSGGGATSIRNSGAHVRYTAPSVPGVKTFTYTVRDTEGATDTAQVTVTVPNRAPTAVDDSVTARAGLVTTIGARNNDIEPDGQTLTITSVTQPPAGRGTVSIASGGQTINFTAPPDGIGQTSFNYTISDGYGGTSTGTVVVTMRPNCGPGTGIVCP